MSVVVGLDLGTSGARAVAVDEAGAVVAKADSSYPLLSPRPGWAEQDPEEWWRATVHVLGKVIGEVNGDVVGLGLTGQMHGAVFLDAQDAVIRPAILWNDQRTQVQVREITETVGHDRLVSITGNPALTGFQAPKVLWLRAEEPEHFRRVARVLLPKDFIRHRLTGEFATDASDAAGTMFLDLRRRNWAGEILEALEVPVDWLPKVHESPEPSGYVRAEAARAVGLRSGIPVAAGAGDNAAAAVGIGIIEPGLVSSSMGTSGVVFAPTSEFIHDPSGRVHAFCHAVPGAYHLMGVTLAAGGSLRWWSDVLGGRWDYSGLAELAATAPPGSEGLLFAPYLSGERTPHLDPFARGAFVGLSTRHGLGHLTRAVMEGVVFSLKDCLEAMIDLGIKPVQVRVVGGGARSDLWRHLQADIYGLPIHRTVVDEGAAYGASLLGAVAAGLFASVEEACSVIRLRPDVIEPDEERALIYGAYYDAYKLIYPANSVVMNRLSELADHSVSDAAHSTSDGVIQ